ncbi:hypothetical protein [Xylocopilactobacillus apis]|uniref:Uncharacterized protein n=1 Tax=Xylocopilactobacillus apis TaxID=2932183 RepID=A0AAU9CZK8_9LACO|nr:hypothetical protein [Xylocopilactobacillus apis]BDR56829.1 hypothetical protein KIMC2_13910 [Xylocopilactobacillus apis]
MVIGTNIAKVFEEVEKIVDLKLSDYSTNEKNNFFDKIIDFVGGVFQPVIPALSGAGMVKAVLMVFNVISTKSQT